MRTDDEEAATVAATACEASERIEIVAERRRAHDAAFRARVAAEALRPGARVQDVAHRYGVCSSLVYRWRRQAEPERELTPAGGFVPVTVTPMRERASAPVRPSTPERGGAIRIELADGVRITVDEGVSTTALRRVLSVLRG